MVQLTIDTKNLRLDLVDACESTPGVSRQLTAFRHYVLRLIQTRMNKIRMTDTLDVKIQKIMEIVNMSNNFFTPVGHRVVNGIMTIDYEQNTEEEK